MPMKPDLMFVLDNAGWPGLLVNESGNILRANPAALQTFGPLGEGSVSLNASIWFKGNSSTAEAFLASAARGQTSVTIVKLRQKDGTIGTFQGVGCSFQRDGKNACLIQFLPVQPQPTDPAATNTFASTPALRGDAPAWEGLAHKQKLDCALQLARTVALDFNNALTSILGHASLILSRIPLDHPWRRSLMEIEKSAEKAAETAGDLAGFSRQEKETTTQAPGNLNELVRRAVGIFQTDALPSVIWGVQLEPKLYSAVFDEAKMQQAFLKIIENAVQSLDAGGQIIVMTGNCDFNDPKQDGGVKIPAGSYVCIEFSDSGCGISPEVLPRVFEPFFTTKDRAKHRGLGLAWVYGIVTNHAGAVSITSQPGGGTHVRVYLAAQKRLIREQSQDADDLPGTGTILVVDDEELLLTMADAILTSYGYRVLTANTGAKAIEIFSRQPDTIDMVITDLVMPQMSGRELSDQLRRIRPQIPILTASGYIRTSGAEVDENYLQKPFTAATLLRKVKQHHGPRQGGWNEV